MSRSPKAIKVKQYESIHLQWQMIAMAVPFLIFFFVFTVLPILSSAFLSLTSYDMVSSVKFIGIDNFRRMLVEDSTFVITVKNTLVFAIIAGPLGFLMSFVLALSIIVSSNSSFNVKLYLKLR